MPQQGKSQSVYFCTECGFESRKWMGQCPACHNWNTFSEEPSRTASRGSSLKQGTRELPKPKRLEEIETGSEERMVTGFPELSRVLGGGVVPGSLILIGGDPGIGKSTLLLQLAMRMADMGKRVLYVSGEESLRQIRLRADRIGTTAGALSFLSEINTETIQKLIESTQPELCIIDSIQTMYCEDIQSSAGSVAQVRECAQRFMYTAKTTGSAMILVGHVTKDGMVAGPRILEHIVDTVMYFEADERGVFRILRSVKNRFGSTNEIGVFEMTEEGLKEVINPSEIMLMGRPLGQSGAVVTCLIEGSRPMLFEVQGLLAETMFSNPRRQTSGMDYNRLTLLLAVLEKRGGFSTSRYDAYVNIAGGMKVTEPAADLAVMAAIISSGKNSPVPEDTLVIGEVGLSGEVRAVSQINERLKEAQSLGFRRVIMPKMNFRTAESFDGLELIGIRYIRELFDLI